MFTIVAYTKFIVAIGKISDHCNVTGSCEGGVGPSLLSEWVESARGTGVTETLWRTVVSQLPHSQQQHVTTRDQRYARHVNYTWRVTCDNIIIKSRCSSVCQVTSHQVRSRMMVKIKNQMNQFIRPVSLTSIVSQNEIQRERAAEDY